METKQSLTSRGLTLKDKLAVVVMAGGKGTRMKSDLPKVLHKVGERPMVLRNIEKLKSIGLKDIFVVIGHQAEEVKKKISEQFTVTFCLQDQPLGTNHALETALKDITLSFSHIFVINGDDASLYSDETLIDFIQSHINSKAMVSMMTLMVSEENQLGRIIRDDQGNFEKILESFEYKDSGLKSNEINCGVYIFETGWVKNTISEVKLNKKGEYPITDLLNIAYDQNKKINLYVLKDGREWAGVNTPEELVYANNLLKGN